MPGPVGIKSAKKTQALFGLKSMPPGWQHGSLYKYVIFYQSTGFENRYNNVSHLQIVMGLSRCLGDARVVAFL